MDVVVVGGGIGGSAIGAALAGAGHAVLLLERTLEFEDHIRGEWLAPWGVAEAKRLGLFEPLMAAGGHILERQISYDERTPPAEAEASPLPLGQLHPEAEGPLCLEHVVMQSTLLAHAQACGVEVRRGVTGLRVAAGSEPSVRYRHEGADREVSCRLVVGADGRSSSVRRQVGIALHEDPIDHLLAGLLIDGAHGWPEDVQSTGRVGDFYYLVFPQGRGKVRLYADFDLKDKDRFAGPEGAERFLEAFDLDCVANSGALAHATPAGPCHAFPSQDAWTDAPFVEGVVLTGDAAGYNDPIIGQGMSITLRDARIVRDLLLSGEDWRPALFDPYAVERRERMRRLRLSARFMTELNARFDEEAPARRARALERIDAKPELALILLAVMTGPEALPAEVFREDVIETTFA